MTLASASNVAGWMRMVAWMRTAVRMAVRMPRAYHHVEPRETLDGTRTATDGQLRLR